MKALVTGATGFIGSHLIEVMQDHGWEVRALVRRDSVTGPAGKTDVERIKGDVRDAGSLLKAVKGVDAIIHAAALVGEWGTLKDFQDINITGMKNIIEAAQTAGVTRFVDISTCTVHGYEGFDHTTEDMPYAISGILYSDTKIEAERMLWEAHAEGRIAASSIRPVMVWGPRDRAFLPKIIQTLKKRTFSYIGDGNNIIGLAHVRNVCDIIYRAVVTEEAIGKAFLANDDCNTTLRNVVEMICDEMKLARPKLAIPVGVAKVLASLSEGAYRSIGTKNAPLITKMGVAVMGNNMSFDVSRAKKILGYKPIYKFPQGLHEFLDWYQAEYRAAE